MASTRPGVAEALGLAATRNFAVTPERLGSRKVEVTHEQALSKGGLETSENRSSVPKKLATKKLARKLPARSSQRSVPRRAK